MYDGLIICGLEKTACGSTRAVRRHVGGTIACPGGEPNLARERFAAVRSDKRAPELLELLPRVLLRITASRHLGQRPRGIPAAGSGSVPS